MLHGGQGNTLYRGGGGGKAVYFISRIEGNLGQCYVTC